MFRFVLLLYVCHEFPFHLDIYILHNSDEPHSAKTLTGGSLMRERLGCGEDKASAHGGERRDWEARGLT